MTIRLWQIEDRGKSIKFNRLPPDRDPNGTNIIFIGRGAIEHISRGRPLANGWIPCEVRLPDWLVEKEGL